LCVWPPLVFLCAHSFFLTFSCVCTVPAVSTVAKQSAPSTTKAKAKPAVSKGSDVTRMTLGSVLSSILDNAVAVAVAEVKALTLEEKNKQAVAKKVDAAIRLRLGPDLESMLVSLGNFFYNLQLLTECRTSHVM
jgi:hypothetical protein